MKLWLRVPLEKSDVVEDEMKDSTVSLSEHFVKYPEHIPLLADRLCHSVINEPDSIISNEIIQDRISPVTFFCFSF